MGRVCDLLIEANNDTGKAEELLYGHPQVRKVDVPALLKQQEENRKEKLEKLEKEVSTK